MTAEGPRLAEFVLSGFVAVVASAFTIFATHWLGRGTHRSAQFRALVSEIDDTTKEIVQEAVGYWRGNGNIAELQQAIVQNIKNLAALIDLAGEWYPGCHDQLLVALRIFNRTATGGRFGSSNHTHDVNRVLDVQAAGMELRIALKKVNRRYYLML